MVQVKGWGGVKPYWWCDNVHTRAVADHLRKYLQAQKPSNGIYIKGTQKSNPESIEINCMNEHEILNINTNSTDEIQLLKWVEQIRLIMEDAVLANAIFHYNKEEYFKNAHTYNLQYTWQQLDKKSKRLER